MAQAQPSVSRRAPEPARDGTGAPPQPSLPTRVDGSLPRRRDLRVTRAPSVAATLGVSVGRVLASGVDRLTGRSGAVTATGRHSHVSPPSTGSSARPASRRSPRPAAIRATPGPTTLRDPASWRWAPMLGVAPAMGLGLSVLTLIGGIGYVHADNVARANQASDAAEHARRDRADVAAAARLTAAATAVAADRRAEALDAARAALEAASAVVVVATDVVTAETLTPLDDAVHQLADMVDQVPDPVSVTDPASGGPTADAGSTSSAASLTAPVTASSPSDASPVASDAPRAASTSAPEPVAEPTSSHTSAAAPSTPSDTTQVRLEDAALGPVAASSPSQTLAALDLSTSARMLEAAEQLTRLSSEVQAVADAVAAERAAAERAAAEAAAAAAAAQRAAEEAAAAELARRVTAAVSSPNGAIPREVLCGVSFDTGTLLRCDAAAALEQLNAAYRAEFGRDLRVSSSYRDYDGQVEVKTSRGDLAATPGTSNHGRGLAVDLDGFGEVGEFTRPGYLWMKANSAEFGWNHPSYMDPGGTGPLEPWHWEYGT